MVTLAVFAGVVVASLIPPVARVDAQELDLIPRPSPNAGLVVPSFADLAEPAIPSIVQITSTAYVEQAQDPMFDNPFFRRFFRQGPEEEDEEREPQRRQRQSGGSGFFITEEGHILTNRHVVEEGEEFRVRTANDQEYEADLIGTDPYMDVALLKVEGNEPFPALALGDSSELRVGEWVIAIGHPLSFDNTVTAGVVSGKGRLLAAGGARDLGRYIQTDAAINFGNSGGPLLNTRGEVVGINTAIVRGGLARNVEGLGFALPVDSAKRVLDELAATGTVKRGWLGVTIQSVDREQAEYYGLERPIGAEVNGVTEGSPADDAGMRMGDIILSVDGEPVEDNLDLVDLISQRRPGDTVELGVFRPEPRERAGERMMISVTLGERRVGLDEEPAPLRQDEGGEDISALGFTVEPMPPRMRESLEEPGVIVTDVDPQSQAYRKGLRPGNVVLEINGQKTPTLSEFRQAVAGVESGDIVQALIYRGDAEMQDVLFFRAP
jgi:serine protease Do